MAEALTGGEQAGLSSLPRGISALWHEVRENSGSRLQVGVIAGITALALYSGYEYGPADETRWTPFFVDGDHRTEYSEEQLQSAVAWALAEDVMTYAEGTDRSDQASDEAVATIETRRHKMDFDKVGEFRLPNYPVEVVVMSDDVRMVDRLKPEAIEDVLMWPYRNAEQLEIDPSVREQAVDSLTHSYDFIREGGLDTPFLIVLPSNFDNACIRYNEIISPPTGENVCSRYSEANVAPIRWWRYSVAASHLTVGEAESDSEQQRMLASTMLHEFAHFVDYKQRGWTYFSLNASNNEAYADAVENFMDENYQWQGQRLIEAD